MYPLLGIDGITNVCHNGTYGVTIHFTTHIMRNFHATIIVPYYSPMLMSQLNVPITDT